MNEELMLKLMEANQKSILILGNQIESIREKVERDQEDQWKIISEITEKLKKLEKDE